MSEVLAPVRPTESSASPEAQLISPAILQWLLFVVVAGVLLFIASLLALNLYFQHHNYTLGIQLALRDPVRADHASVLSYARSWDFAVVKTSALFLAFLLTFTGALYVLRSADTKIAVTLEGARQRGSLETSSPGLVMICLGVGLVAFVLYSKSAVEYTRPKTATAEILSRELAPVTTTAAMTPPTSTPKAEVKK